jgi:putative ABC transport system substrate-binding protein
MSSKLSSAQVRAMFSEGFAALRGRVDFVWCLPDNNLFPSAAIPPIILASIRNQLPVIGFSEGFVRAGASVGFYPDYADIGVQTAETVKRYLSRQEVSRVEAPRKVRMAVNDRVLRILGVERPNLSSEVLVIR